MDLEQHLQNAHVSHPDTRTSVGHRHNRVSALIRIQVATLLAALIPLLFSACSPSGPKALEQGETALNQGYYPEAIRILSIAVDKLPREARAWNLLGLAYHGNNQSELAAQAYSKALALDHKLSAARYNLGVLLLEKNQLQPAINELTAFTLLQPRNIDGWLQLASAQLRINKPEAADACYRTILSLQPKHPEALNGLGMISVQRRRYVDAIQFFQAALAENPSYAPALLNQAIVIHRNLNQKATALQKYRQYLALQPRPEQWDSVNQIVQSLTDELTPGAKPAVTLPIASAQTNRSPATIPNSRTNMSAVAGTSSRVNPSVATSTPATTPVPTPRTNPVTTPPAPTTAPAAATPSVTRLPIPVPTPNPVQPQPVKPEVSTPAVTSRPITPVEPPPPAIEIAEISKPLEVQPIKDIPPERTGTPPSGTTPAASAAPAPAASPAPVSTSLPPDERRGFFSRLNPFRSSRSKPESTPVPAPTPTPAVKPPAVAPTPPPVPKPQPAPAPASAPSGNFQRYTYLNPSKPRPGDRQKAAILVNKGIEAHNSRELDEEIGFYRSATLTDPSSYDAFFNLGLASAERGDWSAALEAYEHALSIDPDSPNSRYNLGVALRQSGYPVDAANEFQRILQGNPTEPKALLALGNLYAQRFNQPKVARQYYQRLLEASPNHPKAAEIRFWLTTNP